MSKREGMPTPLCVSFFAWLVATAVVAGVAAVVVAAVWRVVRWLL